MLARDPLSALNSRCISCACLPSVRHSCTARAMHAVRIVLLFCCSVIEAARARPTDADVAIKAASQKTWSKLCAAQRLLFCVLTPLDRFVDKTAHMEFGLV